MTRHPDPLEARIEQLESRLAFVDDAQNSLSDVLARQARDIEALRHRLEALATQLQEIAHAAGAGVSRGEDDGPPPHY